MTCRPERMLEEGRHMIALDPNHFLGHWTLGIGMGEAGAWSDAAASMERSDELSGSAPFTTGFRAYVCGRAGRADDTRRLLDRLEQASTAGYVPPSAFALTHIGLQDWDAALRWFDKAIEARDPIVMPIKTFPFLDPVRGDVRYRELLQKMRLGGQESSFLDLGASKG